VTRLSLLLLAACSADTTETPSLDDEARTGLPAVADVACAADETVVQLSTGDGLTLVADYTPPPTEDAGLAVFFHMTPVSGFNRADWPASVRSAFAALGLGVLVVDRRGAGDSEGEAEEAFVGDGGRLDVEAAVRAALASTACTIDPDRIALIGASNGTTSVFDYAVAHADDLPDPARLAFLSPGTYTENQHDLTDGWDRDVPLLWLFPSNEPFSLDFVDGAPGDWEFQERGFAHGTRMFDGGDLEADTVADLVRAVATPL
jgi:pimeloyl-ACP methyl ester carboxylesterase